jgi:hypothetical protein
VLRLHSQRPTHKVTGAGDKPVALYVGDAPVPVEIEPRSAARRQVPRTRVYDAVCAIVSGVKPFFHAVEWEPKGVKRESVRLKGGVRTTGYRLLSMSWAIEKASRRTWTR